MAKSTETFFNFIYLVLITEAYIVKESPFAIIVEKRYFVDI